MTDHEQRRSIRTPLSCRIKIMHATIGEMTVKTRDISDGGVFVIIDPQNIPKVGTVVTGQVQGLMDEAPVLEMEVVRIESEGVGLRFLIQD
jgi:hypothetical protein